MLLKREEAAKRLGVSSTSLGTPRFRLRIGLPVVRIGGAVRFDEADIERIIRKGKERLPVMAEK
jgi:hypothetical protein